MAVSPDVKLDYRHALVAPGQGSQKEGMGKALAMAVPAAMDTWLEANRALGFKASKLAWTRPLSELTETQNAQVLISVDAMARAKALESTDQMDAPGWHAGQSLGFVVAAINAGAMSLEGGVSLALQRGRIFKDAINNSPRASMLSLQGLALEYRDELANKFGLYDCLISPGEPLQVTMGGWQTDIDLAAEFLGHELNPDDYKAAVFPLTVDTAFHSPILEPALPAYTEAVNGLPITEPTKGRLVGASTVRELTTPQEIREELISQLTHVENWKGAMDLLILQQGVTRVTELNETIKLAGMIRRGYKVPGVVDGQRKDKMGRVDEIDVPGTKIVIARRWNKPVPAMAGGAGETRDEIKQAYLEYIAGRTGYEPESDDLNGETEFMEAFGGESVELITMRQWSGSRFGINIDPEIAGKLVKIDMAVEELYHLLNPEATDYDPAKGIGAADAE